MIRPHISDEHILELLNRKDSRGIALLYDKYASALYGVICRIVIQEELAEHVLQDAFVKVWKNIDRYDADRAKLYTWIMNIARNAAIDMTRSRDYKKTLETRNLENYVHLPDEAQTDRGAEGAVIRETVNKLDEKYREVIDLIYFGGYTQVEAAEHLRLPLGTVKTRVRIAMRELRKWF